MHVERSRRPTASASEYRLDALLNVRRRSVGGLSAMQAWPSVLKLTERNITSG